MSVPITFFRANKVTFFTEWSIPTLAMAQFAKVISINRAQEYNYYHGINSEFYKRSTNFSFELKSAKDSEESLLWFNNCCFC